MHSLLFAGGPPACHFHPPVAEAQWEVVWRVLLWAILVEHVIMVIMLQEHACMHQMEALQVVHVVHVVHVCHVCSSCFSRATASTVLLLAICPESLKYNVI
jgi:hypothetical protein